MRRIAAPCRPCCLRPPAAAAVVVRLLALLLMHLVGKLIRRPRNVLARIADRHLRVGMGTFVARTSPITGKQEWVVQDEKYDYIQEIARSAYADMLHDTERNQKYYLALKDAIQLMHKRGQQARVLDIGTGTGLLSMMAAACRADAITACEAFRPMAECAKRVITDNGFKGNIRLIPKRSTEITVGPDGDMPERANILVTEVFDTELIGEGAIGTFHHAHEHLLQKDCIVVPSAANMFVQVVQSELAQCWNRFQPIGMGDQDDIRPPPSIAQCPGTSAVHDLQLEQVSCDHFKPIMEPVRVFRFDYSGQTAIEFCGESHRELNCTRSGRCDAVYMWWELEMDTRGKVLLSCAPSWAHPQPHELQWRDHWMQAIYYPPSQLSIEEGHTFHLHSYHDDYSLWFDVATSNNNMKCKRAEAPACQCGAHVACSRTRIGMLNDQHRNRTYLRALKKVVREDTVCLCITEGSLLPLMVAKLGAKQVYTSEHHQATRTMVRSYLESNCLQNRVKIIDKGPEEITLEDTDGQKVNLVVGEPYFSSSTLPWHNLYFWYSRTDINSLLADKVTVLPRFASLRAIAVDFEDLWKIRAPVGNCEGFDLTFFDKMIEEASDATDAYIEPQPLWEYPGVPLTEQFDILNFDFSRPLGGIRTMEREGVIEICSSGTCNGVAIWMEYVLDQEGNDRISTGLVAPPKPKERLQWDIHSRQGVHLFKHPRSIDANISDVDKKWKLRHKIVFKPSLGEFNVEFSLVT